MRYDLRQQYKSLCFTFFFIFSDSTNMILLIGCIKNVRASRLSVATFFFQFSLIAQSNVCRHRLLLLMFRYRGNWMNRRGYSVFVVVVSWNDFVNEEKDKVCDKMIVNNRINGFRSELLWRYFDTKKYLTFAIINFISDGRELFTHPNTFFHFFFVV